MTLMKTDTVNAQTIEQVLVSGDLSKLTAEQRNIYYKSVCESLGLNPLTRPFDYITLNGKLTLYARKDCTDQLRKINGVSIRIVSRETVDGVVIVTAQATDKAGRIDESTGAVASGNLRGEALANCWMKAETKAKRRVTLSLCGLGFTDESEVDSIPNARLGEPPAPQTRATDRLVSGAPVPVPTAAQPEPTEEIVAVEPLDHAAMARIDVKVIDETRNKNGTVLWKVTDADGGTWAVFDSLIVEDLNSIKENGTMARVIYETKGKSRLITDVQEVTQ